MAAELSALRSKDVDTKLLYNRISDKINDLAQKLGGISEQHGLDKDYESYPQYNIDLQVLYDRDTGATAEQWERKIQEVEEELPKLKTDVERVENEVKRSLSSPECLLDSCVQVESMCAVLDRYKAGCGCFSPVRPVGQPSGPTF